MSKKMMSQINGITQLAIAFFMGSIMLLIFILILHPITKIDYFTPLDGKTLLIMLYIGVAITGLGYYCFSKALEKTSAMAASLVFFIKPVLTPFFALIIVPETKLTFRIFVALILVVAGSVIATYKRTQKVKKV